MTHKHEYLLGPGEALQGDELEPAPKDENPLFGRHSKAEITVLEEAIGALYLYGGCRGIRGAFFTIVKALDNKLYAEMEEEGPDWVYKKYFSED